MLPKEALATVVRALRNESKRSQDELAAIDQSHLSRVERGKVDVSLQMFFRIASMLEIEPAVLMLLTDSLKTEESVETVLERTHAKLAALKKRGVIDRLPSSSLLRTPGRPPQPEMLARSERALQLKREGMSLAQIAKELKVSKTTVHRYLSGQAQ
ncbi:TPA: transcriptional regulator [Pseudomonas putida]|nr:transcriptional regulator [Pseudomonas putida]